MQKARFSAVLCVAAAAALVLIAGSGRLAERTMLDSGDVDYDMHPGQPQPANWVHFDRHHDPWARDGFAKRGSFTVERKVEHDVHDGYWLTVTGTPGHNIKCTVRGFEVRDGKAEYAGWARTYNGKTAVVTGLLPKIEKNNFDSIQCHDRVTGESRFFQLLPFKPETPPTPQPWETNQAVAWMKQNGLNDFTPEDAPLHNTRGEAQNLYNQDGDYTPGEKYLYLHGHPPIYQPEYQEYMGGNLDAKSAKAAIPYKGEYKVALRSDKRALQRKRVWSAYWNAWQAGRNKDRQDGVPRSEWRQHWN